MTAKRKAVSPSKAGTLEKTASTPASKPRNSRTIRQRIKQIIVCSYCWGFIPVGVAEWLIQRGGLTHD
jgi:hypothetical protein